MEKQVRRDLLSCCILASLFSSFVGFVFSFVFIDEGLDFADNKVTFVFWRAFLEETYLAFTYWGIFIGFLVAFFCSVCLCWSAPKEGHYIKAKLFAIRFAVVCWLISCAGPLIAAALIYSSET